MAKGAVLFIIETDAHTDLDNVPLIARYLRWAMERSKEARFWHAACLPADAGRWDDRMLIHHVVEFMPNVLAATERDHGSARDRSKTDPAESILEGV